MYQQTSANQNTVHIKSVRKTFGRKFVSGSLFVSPCQPECNFQSETKTEPDLRLRNIMMLETSKCRVTSLSLIFLVKCFNKQLTIGSLIIDGQKNTDTFMH